MFPVIKDLTMMMIMVTRNHLRSLVLLVIALATSVHSLSSLNKPKPQGCAATPLNKRKIAVFGAGGYLGGLTFGFLQRASSLYGTGMGGVSSPRNVCATAINSMALNKILSKNFVLAYAGEDQMKLTNMIDVDMIASRLQGFGAAVIGTAYHLERRPVTSCTYDQGPNSKTWEFYLEGPRRSGEESQADDQELHLQIFENTLRAAKQANLEHIFVVESPRTKHPEDFGSLLNQCGVPFTYLRIDGELDNFPDHTHLKGVQGDLSIGGRVMDTSTNWMADLAPPLREGVAPLYREDLAACIVQSLQSLNWGVSRCLRVASLGDWEDARKGQITGRHDQEWCGNSDVLAQKLLGVA